MLDALTPADIPEVMRIERQPGYDALVGRFEAPEHARQLGLPDVRYFGLRGEDGLLGFVILQELEQPAPLLKRIAVDTVERGVGGSLVRGAMDWVFEQTPATALRLWVLPHNARARRVYEREGFGVDGEGDVEDVPHLFMSVPRARWEELRGG
jgi:RimJ/RimL family protein N-acetyltransferase